MPPRASPCRDVAAAALRAQRAAQRSKLGGGGHKSFKADLIGFRALLLKVPEQLAELRKPLTSIPCNVQIAVALVPVLAQDLKCCWQHWSCFGAIGWNGGHAYFQRGSQRRFPGALPPALGDHQGRGQRAATFWVLA